MLTLLIAIINDTYEQYSSYDESIFLIEKYFIMDYYYNILSPYEQKQQRLKYCNVEYADDDSLDMSSEDGNSAIVPTSKHDCKFQIIEPISGWFNRSTTLSTSLHTPKTSLFIIDPQVDFHPGGALAVPNADNDSEKIADMIIKNKHLIHEIFVSMDTRYIIHISHGSFWRDESGCSPPPYTVITYSDVKQKKWIPRDESPGMKAWCLTYTKTLERKGRVKLTIWPEHCIIGSRGHTVVPSIDAALQEWAAYSKRPVTYVMKGQNSRSEMYSALEAEVEDSLDGTTAFNAGLMSMLRSAERLVVCGQALSHSVKFTFMDIMKHWQGKMNRIILLEDGCSPLPGHHAAAEEFKAYALKEGAQILTTFRLFNNIATQQYSAHNVIELEEFITEGEQKRSDGIEFNSTLNGTISTTADNQGNYSIKSKVSRGEDKLWGTSAKMKQHSFMEKILSRVEDVALPLFIVKEDFSQKSFMDHLIKLNTYIHNDSQRLFYHLKSGDILTLKEQLTKQLQRFPSSTASLKFLMGELDAMGANIIHVAYLNEHYGLGHWLVERFPELALMPYGDKLPLELKNKGYSKDMMPYTGENILHMVIVRRNYEEVRWLLDFFKDHKDSVPHGLAQLLISNATGKFFNVKGDFYFGGYPLQFAVCSNSIEIFDLVLSFASTAESSEDMFDEIEDHSLSHVTRKGVPSLGPNVIFMRDSYGNTVLHLCVMHCLQGMFAHVFKVAETIISREIKLLYSTIRSTEFHTSVFQLESFEEISKITTGYSVNPKKMCLPADDKYEEWIRNETITKMNERLLLVLNNDLHSPLTLASVITKDNDSSERVKEQLAMLEYLMSKLKTVLWEYGPIQCSEVNLEGLEVKYNLANYGIRPGEKVPKHESLISWLCIYDVEPAIMIPEIRRIIESKWERCGLPSFLTGFVVDVLIVILITLTLIFGNYTITQSTDHALYWFINIMYALIFVTFLCVVFSELRLIHKYRDIIRRLRGIAWFHVVCRLVKIISFSAFCISRYYHLQTNSIDKCEVGDESLHPQDLPEIKIPLVLCVMTSWIHLYYYMMCFEKTGLYVLTLTRIIVRDVPHFLRFYVISLFAFSSAIAMLGNNGNYHTRYAFWHYLKTLWTLIQETVVSIPSDDQAHMHLVPEDLRWLSDIWNTMFFYGVAFVMINLLIAIINSTYRFYTTYNEETKGFNNESILLIEKFNVMDYYEQHLSDEELHQYRDSYAMLRQDDDVEQENNMVDNGSMKSEIVSLQNRQGSVVIRKHNDESSSIECNTDNKTMNFKYFFQIQEEIVGWLNAPINAWNSDSVRRTCLLVIEPQVDYSPGGVMGIPTADREWNKITKMIKENKHEIHEIIVVMDTHFPVHIGHASFWTGREGQRPRPKTIISHDNVKSGVWLPRDNTMLDWCLQYTKSLERNGKMKLTVWPDHCILGSKGHTVMPSVNVALQEWAADSNRQLDFVMKGQNYRTEMYSALEAEVEDPLDSSTLFNAELMSTLRVAERVVICGHATSHCYNHTLRDIVRNWHGDTSRIVALKSDPATSKVMNRAARQLVYDMAREGVTFAEASGLFRNNNNRNESKEENNSSTTKI
mmetsp:Transcript_6116/g.8528  ORF Transcript_6116/g.8528 Transcript_6116/m.8528 type:complete len:1586 (-) Transcript_6116:145-4902(-)